jgi:redox-sensitive bicupin YhaK (pirin superfamily)
VEKVSTEPCYFDVALESGGALSEPVSRGHGAFLYVIDGAVEVLAGRNEDDRIVPAGILALLGDGERVQLTGREPRNRMLLVSANRLGEPVSRAGPFVMNTREEIIQAFEDYKKGRF